jgi:hypothetical protein
MKYEKVGGYIGGGDMYAEASDRFSSLNGFLFLKSTMADGEGDTDADVDVASVETVATDGRRAHYQGAGRDTLRASLDRHQMLG